MSLIDETYFTTRELKLPIDNIDDIQEFIDYHEKIILQQLLGYELYKEFIAAIDGGSPAQKWLDLRDGSEYTDITTGELQNYEGLLQISADYVYFNVISDKQSYATDSGITGGQTENAIATHPRYKQVWAYNDMVDRSCTLSAFILAANDSVANTYPNYDEVKLTKTNILNI